MSAKCLVIGVTAEPNERLAAVIERLQSLGFDVEYQQPGPCEGLEFDYLFVDDMVEGEYDRYKTVI